MGVDPSMVRLMTYDEWYYHHHIIYIGRKQSYEPWSLKCIMSILWRFIDMDCFLFVCVFFGDCTMGFITMKATFGRMFVLLFFKHLKQFQVCPDTPWGSSIYLRVGSLRVNVGIYTIHWAFGLLSLLIKCDTIDLIDFKKMDSLNHSRFFYYGVLYSLLGIVLPSVGIFMVIVLCAYICNIIHTVSIII